MRYSKLTVPDYKVWDGKKRRYVTKKKYYKDERSEERRVGKECRL